MIRFSLFALMLPALTLADKQVCDADFTIGITLDASGSVGTANFKTFGEQVRASNSQAQHAYANLRSQCLNFVHQL